MTEETRRIILEEAARQDAEYNKYHNWEQGTKILINSFYGGLGNKYMYFFNVDLAECITKQGKDAILYAERNINRYFLDHWHRDKRTHRKMGITVKGQVKNQVTVYIDTDSVYSQLDEVISTTDWGIGPDHPNWKATMWKVGEKDPTIRYFGGNNPEEYVVKTLGLDDTDVYSSYTLELVEGTAKDFALLLDEVFLADYFKYIFDKYAEKINADNYLNFELESYADAGIWLAKKKYMQNIRWLDKIPRHEIYDNLSKIKSKGVEIIQASAPNYARKSLKHLVRWIFERNDFEMKDIIAEVKEIKRGFMVAEVDDICWNKKSNNYHKFVLDDRQELVLDEGTPIYVKGVALYNHLLNKHPQFKSKYARLKDGMTCKFYYCLGEELDFFAYEPGMRPVEYAPEPDREKMFEKTILEPLNRILSVIPDKSVIGRDLMYVGKLF